MLAECHAKSGNLEAALRALAEATEVAEENGERFYEPELHRLTGEFYLAAGRDRREAEEHFVRALDTARRQESRLFELRAATSLAHLIANQGKRDDAREVLAPVYTWFTESLDTDDLQSARAVLDRIR
jgi:predicted ATPase